MNPTGVRLACPDCQLDVVMTSEQDCPAPVTKVIEGIPWCPNCDIPMALIASVNVTDRPPGIGLVDHMDDHQRLEKLRELEREVQEAEGRLSRLKADTKDAKDVYDARVVTLRTAIRRLTATPAEKPPLLALAEEPGDQDETEDEEPETDNGVPQEAIDEPLSGTLDVHDEPVEPARQLQKRSRGGLKT